MIHDRIASLTYRAVGAALDVGAFAVGAIASGQVNGHSGGSEGSFTGVGQPTGPLGTNSHYLTLDGLGSPVATTDHAGVTTATYAYDPLRRHHRRSGRASEH